MKIVVCSKSLLKAQYNTDKQWFKDETKYFISIAGLRDGCEYPCPFLTQDSQRVLHLLCDDVTDVEKDNPSVILFDNFHANKIINFIKKIPSYSTIYINCTYGISRSGAIGQVLNTYFNKNNSDYELFYNLNKKICPNLYIKHKLSEILFDTQVKK